MTCAEMKERDFAFQKILEDHKLTKFVELSNNYFDQLVRCFYCNMNVHKGILKSTLYGKKITITPALWKEVLDVEYKGITLSTNSNEFASYDKFTAIQEMLREGVSYDGIGRLLMGKLKVESRMLHYVVAKIISARLGNYARVNDDDVLLMWALYHHKGINWSAFFISRMEKASKQARAHFSVHQASSYPDTF